MSESTPELPLAGRRAALPTTHVLSPRLADADLEIRLVVFRLFFFCSKAMFLSFFAAPSGT